MILMFIGPSSSGKDTFLKPTLEKFSLKPIVLSTTRPMREKEIDGKSYHFISMEEMNALDKQQKLVERRNYNTVNGLWSYATNAENIRLSENYLVANTWEGYQKYLEFYGKENVVPIYFQVEDKVRYERALAKKKKKEKPNYQEAKRRFIADTHDFNPIYLQKYQPIIIDNNHSLKDTQNQINKVVSNILQKQVPLFKEKTEFKIFYQKMRDKSRSLLGSLSSLRRSTSCEGYLKQFLSRRFREENTENFDKILSERNQILNIATNIDIISKRYHDLEDKLFEQLNVCPLLEETQYQSLEQIYNNLKDLLEKLLQTENCPTYEMMEDKISLQGLKLRLMINDVNNFFTNLTPLKICLTEEQRRDILSSYETCLEISKFYGRYEIIATCLTKKLGYDTYRKWMLSYLALKIEQEEWNRKESDKELALPQNTSGIETPNNASYHLIKEKKEMW